MRGETIAIVYGVDTQSFQSTPLMRGETRRIFCNSIITLNFNPLPSCEGRPPKFDRNKHHAPFQSTPLMRGETQSIHAVTAVIRFQSTPLMRGETVSYDHDDRMSPISIHSPHARGDDDATGGAVPPLDFNPLPSCEGRLTFTSPPYTVFDFNPLPSCEGRPDVTRSALMDTPISIHSPHARGDSINFQRIHRIQGSLYNTIHFTRFREFFQSVLGRKNAVYAVRSSPENHDSFTFAQPFLEYTVTP